MEGQPEEGQAGRELRLQGIQKFGVLFVMSQGVICVRARFRPIFTAVWVWAYFDSLVGSWGSIISRKKPSLICFTLISQDISNGITLASRVLVLCVAQ